jgi:hypothetical protein
MRPTPRRRLWIGVFAALALAGCGTGGGLRLFVNPKADMTFYKQIAIVPFGNLTSDHFAGERVGRAFMTELVIANRFHLIEDGQFRKALERANAAPDPQGQYESEKVRQVATTLEVQGIIRGTVTDYQVQHFGSNDSPVVGFDVEMIDVQSGETVWRGSITRHGKGPTPLIGGASTETLGHLVQQTCRELVDRLTHEAF